ncbi:MULTISPECIES: protein TolR [Acinetobacter]|jgi:biopolymer transport protein TolR|uniref:Tol-Pal system protein TolR n=2 Tax=Acinetobacter TaxID=469 RepID=A0A3A8EU98_9GAMM|nr:MULTISPECIES: protein TolR [Acinetobacter]EOR02220.1 protein TolR [Acinetobacter genomosp. 15BJ]MCH7293486.1 protein TolR [Acinetobacter genomosp. 15BJ]RKG37016.1 protein TolR [Acinetobacter rongchengensis]WVH57828.1 protein TolR [Acinetobacter pittii]
MIKRPQKLKPNAEMNVVPYIDVMLVLLVIFMVTAPMLTQGIKIDLPKVDADVMPASQQQRIVTLSIQANGQYYWNIGSEVNTEKVTDQAIDLSSMQQKLIPMINNDQSLQFYVRADQNADYQLVAQAIAVLQKSGVTNLGLITEEPQS